MRTDAFGDRMKAYEDAWAQKLPGDEYVIVRLDGRSFGRFTKDLEKPYDPRLAHAMNVTAFNLVNKMQGAKLAYTHSDEISILLTAFEEPSHQLWFGGKLQKIVSLAASIASSIFNEMTTDWSSLTAEFDARAFTLPSQVETAKYFIWRQRDCRRNAISSAARTYFSHQQLDGVSSTGKIDMMLQNHAVDFDADYPIAFRRGVWLVPNQQEYTGTYQAKDGSDVEYTSMRNVFEVKPAPQFDSYVGGDLMNRVPQL